ncbi:MAG: glycosyltransferase, partial [Proteobacteria bacterium]
FQLAPEIDVSVVDDSSPDGTADVIREALAQKPEWKNRFHLIVRSKKDGRGGAIREGFRQGFESPKNYDYFIEMDCDFSHRPEAIVEGIAQLDAGKDVVLGSRYPNGTIEGWPVTRHVLSFFANTLARTLISWSIADYTNGFRFYTRRSVQELLKYEQKHKGYIYLSESLSQLLRAGMKVGTFPIFFKNRERGVSNTSLTEVKNAFTGVFQIGWEHRFGGSKKTSLPR